MLDLLKKNVMIGIGLASITQTKLKEMGKKIAEDSKLSEAEGEKFVSDILKQAEDAKSSMEKKVTEIVEKTVAKMKLPCSSNFDKVLEEIKELKAEIKKLEKKLKD